jgi:hypothetical protein
MKLANFPLKVSIALAALVLLAGPARAAETLVNITGTGVHLTFVQVDCAGAATTTGIAVASGATGGVLQGLEVKNCTTRGISAAETVVLSNSWVHDNQDDIDIAAGKTVTASGKNVFDDALADKGAGTYTDGGGVTTTWENTLGKRATNTGGTPFLTYAEFWAAGGDLLGKGPTGAGYSVGPKQYQKSFEADVDEMITMRSKSTAAGSYVQP